jgi:hypothetical protein
MLEADLRVESARGGSTGGQGNVCRCKIHTVDLGAVLGGGQQRSRAASAGDVE